ncbi:hypothetical protein H2198_009993, partial [Neophaeococcomyces mojaviensis]
RIRREFSSVIPNVADSENPPHPTDCAISRRYEEIPALRIVAKESAAIDVDDSPGKV